MTETAPQTWTRTLPPEPQSVREARTFVCDHFVDLGYAGLAETAALCVSELATNAVLHARSPFTVRVTELGGNGVRTSIGDRSRALPEVQRKRPNVAIGRGLRLVDRLTDAWGTQHLDDDGDLGKEVWFDLGLRITPNFNAAPVYDPAALDLRSSAAVPAEVLVEVTLLNTPLRLFAREMSRHAELMREMALIAFTREDLSGVPSAITALAAELEQYRGVGAATDALRDRAIERGDATIDLVYTLPPAVGPACTRLNQLLDEADRYCESENLLTLAAPPAGSDMRRWYLGEIARQIAGEPAQPWTGPLD